MRQEPGMIGEGVLRQLSRPGEGSIRCPEGGGSYVLSRWGRGWEGARNRNKQECGMIFCPEQGGGDVAEAEILIFPHASCFLPTEVGGQKASG